MKFKLDKQVLQNQLQYAQDVAEQGSINVYYSYFIFEALHDKFRLRSADRQTTLQIEIVKNNETKLEIEEPGEALLPANKIYSIIIAMPDGVVVFEQKEEDIVIYTDDGRKEIQFSIRPRDVSSYPKIHHEMPEKSYPIQKNEFLRIIKNTSFAASPEARETTLFLTGIYFEIKDSHLIAVATDRNRISISKMKLDTEIDFPLPENNDLIVPSKSINFIKRVLLKENTGISIAVKEERIFFQLENFLITANVISGKYYDYARIIPKETRNYLKVRREEIQKALERIAAIADDRKDVVVLLDVSENSLTLTTEEREKGEGMATLDIELHGKPSKFQIKSQFLVDPLKIIETEHIIIEYGEGPRDLIKIVSVPEYDTMHIAAPINL